MATEKKYISYWNGHFSSYEYVKNRQKEFYENVIKPKAAAIAAKLKKEENGN